MISIITAIVCLFFFLLAFLSEHNGVDSGISLEEKIDELEKEINSTYNSLKNKDKQ